MVDFNQYLAAMTQIPTTTLLNIFLLLLVFTLLYINPYKPKPRDLWNWWKLRLYKNPSIHRIIYPNGDEKEYILSKFDDKVETKYDGEVKRTYIMNQKLTTRRNKVPIFTHHFSKAQGVDFFNQREARKLDNEKFCNLISNARINMDLLKEIWKKKDLVKYILVLAICAAAAAGLSFQDLNLLTELMQRIDAGQITVNCANIAADTVKAVPVKEVTELVTT